MNAMAPSETPVTHSNAKTEPRETVLNNLAFNGNKFAEPAKNLDFTFSVPMPAKERDNAYDSS